MIHRLFTLATLVALANAASAQGTSVTLSGVIDLHIGRAEAGPRKLTRMEEGGLAASRLVFRGTEDLGGGSSANFVLESGIAPDTGSGTLPGPSLAFTRQSYVGLAGRFGAIELGRMYTPMFYTLLRGDPFNLNTVFSTMNLVAATDAQNGVSPFAARANNMIRWRTPSGSAWFGDVAFAPGESAQPSRRSADVQGLGFGYSKGPAYLAFGMQRTKSGSAAAPVAAPATSTYKALSGGYDFGGWRLTANWVRNSSDQSTVPDATIANVGVSASAGPFVQLVAGYTQRKVDGSPRGQRALSLGGDYLLSKRTALYARWLRLDNRAQSSASLAQVTVTANSGEDPRLVAIGVRHAF